MCYHTALIATPQQLAQRYGRKADLIGAFAPSYHISAFAHAEYPVVTADEQMQYFRWGLIPFWTDTVEDAVTIRNRTLNARAETILSKPSFRDPVRKRRCLVPASGFFDWHREAGRKIPFYITVKDSPLFCFAGIYDCWYNKPQDEYVGTYSIITTRANSLMQRIDNTSLRMPVILLQQDEERWLDPSLSDARIAALLNPYPDGRMRGVEIRSDFMRKAPEDPTILLRPAEAILPDM